MSAMERIHGNTKAAANGTTNGSLDEPTNSISATESSIQRHHITISQISVDLPNPSQSKIRGIITLLWPYSSLTKSLALNLAEKDVRLRTNKGQVKISFTGPLGKHLGAQGLNIDDELILSLEGAEIIKTAPRDSRDVGWELKYSKKLIGQITNRPNGDMILDHEAQCEIAAAPAVPVQTVVEIPSPMRSPPRSRVGARQNEDGEWVSPAFIKRARLSYGSLMSNDFDAFIGEDGTIPGRGRKKARFEPRKSGTWRYQSESRSPSPDVGDTPMAEAAPEPEKPKVAMMEQGCQTDDLPYNEGEIQEFFRQSQAIGREVRQDQPHHVLQDDNVQTMLGSDQAEMFSPITFPAPSAPSTMPFGNPPVPLFAQGKASTTHFGYPHGTQASTTPFGMPSAQMSTNPSEPFPEQYRSLVSPLASRSTAPVHEEGQWPASLFENMGYRSASSLTKSTSKHDTFAQSTNLEIFSPLPISSLAQGAGGGADDHNSAALALEELSRIHHAQQVEDAIVDYEDPSTHVLEGSLKEVAPALSPPRQLEYPDLEEHTFLSPAQLMFGSRRQSPQHESQPRQGAISYPAERYSRERSGTPQNRRQSPISGSSPLQRAGSHGARAQSETIDLTGESDEGEEEEEGSEAEDEDEQTMPGESFEQTKARLLTEADSEEEEKSGEEGDEDIEEEENITELGIPKWRGQPQKPSMIPKSDERIYADDDASQDDRGVSEGRDSRDGEEEEEAQDEIMSEMDFGNRGVLINPPKPRVLGDRTNEGMNAVQDELDEDAEGEEEYYSDGQPPSLREHFSDDEGDSEEEPYSDDPEAGRIDPDDAIMPESDSEQYDEEEYEEEEEVQEGLDYNEPRYGSQEAEDMGPGYGRTGDNSRQQSQGPPVVIDLLSSDDDEPEPPRNAVARSSPPPATQHTGPYVSQRMDGDEENMEAESDNSEYRLDVEADDQISDAESGHENATEIAEQEREVYDEEHDDSSRKSFQSQEDRDSPMSPAAEEAEVEQEESGYEDEDATAEEVQTPQDMVAMDGGWESKPAKSSPKRSLFKPFTQSSPVKPDEALPAQEKIKSVEPPPQEAGEDADVEDADFEVPKENFDEAEPVKPADPTLLAARDEDHPVETSPVRPRQGAYVDAMDDDVQDVPTENVGSPNKPSDRDAAIQQLATAGLMADRDEGRPVQVSKGAVVTCKSEENESSRQAETLDTAPRSDSATTQLATAPLMAERDEDRPLQATQGPADATTNKQSEAALLALEAKVNQDVDSELRASKDQELTEEAEHDIEMAEIIASPVKIEGRIAIEKEIAQDVQMEDTDEKPEFGAASVVEPGPRGDPEDVEMDGDIRPADGGLEASSVVESDEEQEVDINVSVAADDNEQMEPHSDVAVPEVIISRASEVIVASDGEQQDDDEDEYEDPSSQLFDEMSYIERHADEIRTEVVTETMAIEVEEDDAVESQFNVSEKARNSAWVTQQSQMGSVFSQEVADTAATSFQTPPASHPQAQSGDEVQEAASERPPAKSLETPKPMETSENDTAVEDNGQMLAAEEEQPTNHTKPHDDRATGSPTKEEPIPDIHVQHAESEPNPTAMDVDEYPASQTRSHEKQVVSANAERSGSPAAHTRSHDADGQCVEDDNATLAEADVSPKQTGKQDIKMQSIEQDEHPASHTRSHDKRTEKLQESDRSGSPAEHTRSHDALAGHCVEDDESAKGLQGSKRRKSSSRKSTEQPSEQNTPSKAARVRDVTPVVEIPVTSSIENVQETPPKRVTRSRRGTQESIKAASPLKTRKRALIPVVEVPVSSVAEAEVEPVKTEPSPAQPIRATRSRRGTQDSVKPPSPSTIRSRALTPVVEVPVSSIDGAAAEPVEAEPSPEPPKRVTRSRQGTAEPASGSPPKTRKTRRKSLTPVVEVPASSIQPVQDEPAPTPEPQKRLTRTRKASIHAAPKVSTPPRTRRMSQRSRASPDTTNMSEVSGSMVLKAIDEEDDELPDPGAEALLEYDDSPQKSAAKPSVTSAPASSGAPARNLRGKRNASPELEGSGQTVLETPVKTRARTLRGQPLASQTSSHPTEAEVTFPADPQTPANKTHASNTGTPLVSPSQWATLTPQAVAAQIAKTLRTQLPAYTPLKNIKNHLKKKIDVLAVCVATPETAVKSKHTPYDYALKFFVTEPGSSGTVKEVTAFHHFKKCLPEMRVGNVVLLRNFLVDGQNNGCLRSEKDSSWAVWRKDGAEPEMKSDVPLEFEGNEDEYAKQLKMWWDGRVTAEGKEKMKSLAEKGKKK